MTDFRQFRALGFDCRVVSGDKLFVSGTYSAYTAIFMCVAPIDASDKEHIITSRLFELSLLFATVLGCL